MSRTRRTLLLVLATAGLLPAARPAQALDIIPPTEIKLLVEGTHASGFPFSFRQIGPVVWDMTVDGGPRGGIYRWEQVERRPEFLVLRGSDTPTLAPFLYRV